MCAFESDFEGSRNLAKENSSMISLRSHFGFPTTSVKRGEWYADIPDTR
jgi:hypothetical protein